MTTKIQSISLFGLDGQVIEIETDTTNSLPGITIVGLADQAVEEARERIQLAIKNTGFVVPPKRFVINLVPANLPKKGSHYDLAIAIGILSASGQIEQIGQFDPANKAIFLGELGLDGRTKPIHSPLIAAEVAKRHGFGRLFISADSADTARLIQGVTVYPVSSLRQLLDHLLGEQLIDPLPFNRPKRHRTHHDTTAESVMDQIYGQDQAKRALMIAASGGHNVLLYGPPGTGKTMLARATIDLLPKLSLAEIIEVSKIHGLVTQQNDLVQTRPFRTPHHTTSAVAVVGGGGWPRPGEISLAHHGILFLDEIAEFPRSVLEALRQPLEEGKISLARANCRYVFPTRFLLIATQNPCPCGYAGDPERTCSCSISQIQRYKHKLSGPLLDRIDLHIQVGRPQRDAILAQQVSQSSALTSQQMRQAVDRARKIQTKRFGTELTNAAMTNRQVETFCGLDDEVTKLAQTALDKLHISVRSFYRLLKVSRTIADLEGSDAITAAHFAEALQYRPMQQT